MKMANFDKIPNPFGFKVACFPVKVEKGSAGWTRAVAIVGEYGGEDNKNNGKIYGSL